MQERHKQEECWFGGQPQLKNQERYQKNCKWQFRANFDDFCHNFRSDWCKFLFKSFIFVWLIQIWKYYGFI